MPKDDEDEYFRYFKQSYDSWAGLESYTWSPDPPAIQEIASVLEGVKEGPVLDLACGRGRYISYIKRGEVVGLDLSMNSLKVATRTTGADMVNADARYLPFKDGAFAAVISFGTLAWIIPLDEALLARVKSLLKPSGRFIFTVTLMNKYLLSPRSVLDYVWLLRGHAGGQGLPALAAAALRMNRNLPRMVSMLTTIADAKRRVGRHFDIERTNQIGSALLIEARPIHPSHS